MQYLLSIDQGTASSRALVFNSRAKIVSSVQQDLKQYYPKPGWVEHDPEEIWDSQKETAIDALKKAGLHADQIAAVGITNQRETTIIWDRQTGES